MFSACGKAYVDHPCCITLFEVIQDGGFSEVGHHGHVLNLVELRWVHGTHVVVCHLHDLGNGDDGTLSRGEEQDNGEGEMVDIEKITGLNQEKQVFIN